MAKDEPRHDRTDGAVSSATTGPTLLLLRHGAVASHRGDVALTNQGQDQAERMGGRLADLNAQRVEICMAPTLRAQQTGRLIMRGLTAATESSVVARSWVASALRNPDLFLAGHRVEMVSTAAAFARQVPGATTADVRGLDFFANFLDSDDRIGFWLHHACPPGDDVAAVVTRVRHFALSLGHARSGRPDVVVGVTHSPVLRALAAHYLGSDPGEPEYLHGYAVHKRANDSRDLEITRFAAAESQNWQGGEQWRT